MRQDHSNSLSTSDSLTSFQTLIMVAIKSFLTACTAFTSVLAAPGLDKRQNITPNEEGIHDGYFFSWWSDGASPVTYTNGPGGSYSVQWQSGGNLVGGKGWNPGSARQVST